MTDESWRDAVHRDLSASKRRSKRAPQAYDTAAWKRRRDKLKYDTGCVLCARLRLHVRAMIADHVTPVSDGGAFEGELQPLCVGCHKIKRIIENAWRRGELGVEELRFTSGREALRRRAAAEGVGLDGFQLIRVD